MACKYWTTSEIATLKALLRAGTRMSEIARKLDRTPMSIYRARVAYLNHTPKPHVSEAEVERARAA